MMSSNAPLVGSLQGFGAKQLQLIMLLINNTSLTLDITYKVL